MSPLPRDAGDFTEQAYRGYVRRARRGWPMLTFDQASAAERGCLWRHDVDLSVHRALRLAEIEAEEDVTSTWFLTPRSPFYNLLEPDIVAKVKAILAMGHRLGLHVDVGAWTAELHDAGAMSEHVARERRLLEEAFDGPAEAMSWHNPDGVPDELVAAETVAGMVNAFSLSIRERFAYCSDSNGYWRYRPLADVLAETHQPRLQVLTHPVWWLPEPAAPRQRIARAIDGRCHASHHHYDHILNVYGRENINE